MSYTKFKIVAFGERTTVKVNALPAILDTWYNASDVLKIEKNDPSALGVPFDSIQYQVTDDIVVSNVASILVTAPPNTTIEPESANDVVTVDNQTNYQFIDNVPFNAAVDRIKIVSFNSNGQFTLNGFNIYPGMEIMHYDFQNIVYRTANGSGEPYQTISYQVGNSDGYNPTIYTVIYNLPRLGEIILIGSGGTIDSGIHHLFSNIQVINGRVNGTAKINVDLNITTPAPWSGSPASDDNLFILTHGETDVNYTANFNVDINPKLSEDGIAEVLSELFFAAADAPLSGTLTFTLLGINGNPSLVTGSPIVISLTI